MATQTMYASGLICSIVCGECKHPPLSVPALDYEEWLPPDCGLQRKAGTVLRNLFAPRG